MPVGRTCLCLAVRHAALLWWQFYTVVSWPNDHWTLPLTFTHAPFARSLVAAMRLANLLTLFAAIHIAALIPAHAQFTVTLSNGETYNDSNFGVGQSMEINFTVTGGDIGESQPPPPPPHSSQAAILTPRRRHIGIGQVSLHQYSGVSATCDESVQGRG